MKMKKIYTSIGRYTLLLLLLSSPRALLSAGQTSGDVLNKGIGGNSTADLLRRLGPDLMAHGPDLVIIMAGTNDLLNSGKMVPLATYLRQMRKIADTLLQSGIEVVLISPPPVDTNYLLLRHPPSAFAIPPNEKLSIARDSLRTLCAEKELLFIDLFRAFEKRRLPRHNRDKIIRNEANSQSKDGVHMTAKGNELLAKIIHNGLLQRYKYLHLYRIICFGDSLTYGPFVDGEGTTSGDTYPAVLSRLIRNSPKKSFHKSRTSLGT